MTVTAIVLDCNVFVNWMHPPKELAAKEYSDWVLRQIIEHDLQVWVPYHWDIEVAGVLRGIQKNRAHGYSFEWLNGVGSYLSALDINEGWTLNNIPDILVAAEHFNLSCADTPYFHLAQTIRLPVATLDSGLIAACSRFGVEHFHP